MSGDALAVDAERALIDGAKALARIAEELAALRALLEALVGATALGNPALDVQLRR